MKIIQALVLLIFSQLVYAAGSLYTVSTNFQFEAEPSVGNELRPKISEAWNLVRQRQFDAAVSEVDSVLEEFEKKFNKSEVQLTFQTSDDYKQFSKLHADMKIQRIDWAIREALQIKAYVYSEKKQFDNAIVALNKVISVAPLSAGTLIEKGYILSQLKQNDLAYNTYEEAYKMTTAYKSQLPFQAAALRGMGSNLIDLNKLDDAEEKFNLSLKVEPDNSTALSELKYISSLRNKQK